MEPVSFHIDWIETTVGRRGALVVTPRIHVEVKASRIEELRQETALSPIDDLILEHALAARGKVHACVFRGASDDAMGSYGIDPDLDADTARALATALLRSQMKVYRALVAAGVCLFIHVEFRGEELDAYRDACAALLEECTACLAAPSAAPQAQELARIDTWLLRNLVFYFHLDYNALVSRVLPEKFPLLEKRMGRAAQLVARLSGVP